MVRLHVGTVRHKFRFTATQITLDLFVPSETVVLVWKRGTKYVRSQPLPVEEHLNAIEETLTRRCANIKDLSLISTIFESGKGGYEEKLCEFQVEHHNPVGKDVQLGVVLLDLSKFVRHDRDDAFITPLVLDLPNGSGTVTMKLVSQRVQEHGGFDAFDQMSRSASNPMHHESISTASSIQETNEPDAFGHAGLAVQRADSKEDEAALMEKLWRQNDVITANHNAIENLKGYELHEELRQLREEVQSLRNENSALQREKDKLKTSAGRTRESKKGVAAAAQVKKLEEQVGEMLVQRQEGEQVLAEAFTAVIKDLESKLMESRSECSTLKQRLAEDRKKTGLNRAVLTSMASSYKTHKTHNRSRISGSGMLH